jgi:hypothetical protein
MTLFFSNEKASLYQAEQINLGFQELSIPKLDELPRLQADCDRLPAQISLSQEVRDALSELNRIFSQTSDKKHQQAAQASVLSTTPPEQLFNQIEKLYPDVNLSLAMRKLGTEHLSVVLDHLKDVAKQLERGGYPDTFVNFARNGFSDFLHGHPFCTYVVYAGRSCGTDVVIGASDEVGITPVTSRYPLLTFKYASSSPATLERHICTSDANQGLFLPKYAPHRANRPDLTASHNAELAIVLFALERSPSGKMVW